jgi:Tfp pilus assembly protein PilF
VDRTDNLEALLARGPDSAMLRLTLATAYFDRGELERANLHATAALALDAEYSAAWKLLGKVQAAKGETHEAAETYRRGIAVAERRGDLQAAKEMRVFLRRLESAKDSPAD